MFSWFPGYGTPEPSGNKAPDGHTTLPPATND